MLHITFYSEKIRTNLFVPELQIQADKNVDKMFVCVSELHMAMQVSVWQQQIPIFVLLLNDVSLCVNDDDASFDVFCICIVQKNTHSHASAIHLYTH